MPEWTLSVCLLIERLIEWRRKNLRLVDVALQGLRNRVWRDAENRLKALLLKGAVARAMHFAAIG